EQRELEVNIKYEKQITNQLQEAKELSQYEARRIPPHIDYYQVDNLAKEAREKLTKIKPISLGQARRIGGVNPTDIQMLSYYLNKRFPSTEKL
ncbi:2868_t:CDS:1, partial [Cetraspora pellucida]